MGKGRAKRGQKATTRQSPSRPPRLLQAKAAARPLARSRQRPRSNSPPELLPSSPLQHLWAAGRDGPLQKDVLIAWDVENAKPPARVQLVEAEEAVSSAFAYLPRRKRHSFLAALSLTSLENMSQGYRKQQLAALCARITVMLAAGGTKSTSADAKLLQHIDAFLEQQCATGRAARSVLVLITGDDDFTPRVRRALDAGMDVELLHPGEHTSPNLLEAIRGCPNVWHADWTDFVRHWLGLQPRPAADGGRHDRMDVGGGGGNQRRQGAAAVAGEEGEQPDELEEEGEQPEELEEEGEQPDELEEGGQEVEQDEEEKAGAEEAEEAEDEEWAEEEGPDKDGPDATGHHEMQQRLLPSAAADEAAASGAAAATAAGIGMVAVGELSTRALRALLQRQGVTELAAIPAGTVRSCTKNRREKLRKRMLRAAASALLTVEAALGLPRSQPPGSGDIVVVTPDGMEDDDDGAQPHLQRLVPRYPVYEVAAVEGLLRTSLPAPDLACLLSINAERIQQRRDDGCGSCGGSGGSGGGGGCRDGGESCGRCGGGDEVQRLAEVLWVEHCSRGIRPPCGGVAVRAAAGLGKKRKAETQQPHGTSGGRAVKARQRLGADCEGPATATATATAGGDSSARDAATGTRGHQRQQVEEEGMAGARQRGRRLLSAQAQQVAKHRQPKPARATLLLSSLEAVGQAANKAEALGAVRRWLVEQKRTRSALYSSLQKKALDLGCVFKVDARSATGHRTRVTLTCLDGGAPRPAAERAAQLAANQLRAMLCQALAASGGVEVRAKGGNALAVRGAGGKARRRGNGRGAAAGSSGTRRLRASGAARRAARRMRSRSAASGGAARKAAVKVCVNGRIYELLAL